MKGLELSEKYWNEVGRPAFARRFPGYMDRIAVGLVGMGSECFGFDDEISRDHDFGPAFCVWLTEADYAAAGREMQDLYAGLPGDFAGFPARETSPQGGGRVGVFSVPGFYALFVGPYRPPRDELDWLRLSEPHLAAVTNGRVFFDGAGEFTALRRALLAYYPEDVRLKKLAARAAIMAQSGQYNYARCMRRGETAAAFQAKAEFVRSAIAMVYLLERRFCPFYKWSFRGLSELPGAADIREMLGELCALGVSGESWTGGDFAYRLNRADRNVALMEDISAAVIARLRREGLSGSSSDFLEPHAHELMARIRSEEIRRIHVMEG